MTISAGSYSESSLTSIAQNVLQELVSVDHRGGSSFVRTPLMYPSGSLVVVKLDESDGRYFVSDYGLGYDECELMGGSHLYTRHARIVADGAGVGFDNHAFFVTEATREQLVGAIVTIANCSQDAVGIVAQKLADKKGEVDDQILYRRLVKVFEGKKVVHNAPVIGASNTEWKVSAFVRIGNGIAFETVSKHPVSIYSAATKFNDISRAENPPTRVAVVQNKKEFGTYLSVLAQAANVVENTAPDATFLALSRVA